MLYADKHKIYAIAVLFFISTAAVLIVIGQSSITPANTMEIKNPRIVIRKEMRTLELFDGRKLVKRYKVVLGSAPKGDKEIEGDDKTPEGEFYVFTKNPESRFHRSLGISYPAKDDAKRGLKTS
jgi:murein L,D-transpeptidase YafK